MVWAVRGCSGFGAMKGCIFAGVTWGTAWWFIARDPIGPQSRRYSSAWIILALAAGIGISGGPRLDAMAWLFRWPHALHWLGGFGLMLAIGWFIKSQLFGDFRYGFRGGRLGSGSGWWLWGNFYFAIILAYGAVCARYYLANRNLPGERPLCPPQISWLFVLLSLAPVMGMFVTNEARNWTVNRAPWGWSVFSFGVLIVAA